ncbi:MAG: PKD domain-containing protein [Candidatus Marinimicrobia bacterium]|nr:PKD domain-containing protein [Candidatus Neomarinimicrobiota bacterium]MCF7827743.1 PKD domain-containing protein [Candidatus Neomarinimicrobiota bacterium]MCF7881457.1 PKD domain-containing protein [Candidatus Neomarinimicrobiota bacterium]
MDWCTQSYEEANHPPVPALGHPEAITIQSGEGFDLDASGTSDPDGDNLSCRWFHYPGAYG